MHVTLDQKSLDALLVTPGIRVLDFTAAWCIPCRTLLPILDTLAHEYPSIRFGTIDCDDHPEIAQRFNIRSVPTLVILRDNREVGRIVGSRPRAFIAGVLDRAVHGDVAISAP